MKLKTAGCPSCFLRVEVEDPQLNQRVVCQNCGAITEVFWLDPLELDWPVFQEKNQFSKLDLELDLDIEY